MRRVRSLTYRRAVIQLRLCRDDCDLYGLPSDCRSLSSRSLPLTRVNPSHITQAGGESLEIDGGPFPLTGLDVPRSPVLPQSTPPTYRLQGSRVKRHLPQYDGARLPQSVRRRRRPLRRFTECDLPRDADTLRFEELGASVIGGRPLSIKGRGFSYLQEQGAPPPFCDFGFDTVPASVEDDSTIVCQAPPVTSADTHLVDVRLGRKRYLLPKSTNLDCEAVRGHTSNKSRPAAGLGRG